MTEAEIKYSEWWWKILLYVHLFKKLWGQWGSIFSLTSTVARAVPFVFQCAKVSEWFMWKEAGQFFEQVYNCICHAELVRRSLVWYWEAQKSFYCMFYMTDVQSNLSLGSVLVNIKTQKQFPEVAHYTSNLMKGSQEPEIINIISKYSMCRK